MTRLALLALLFLPAPIQDPARPHRDSPDWFEFRLSDPETGERRVECYGIGKEDHENGTAELRRVQAKIFTKADPPKEQSHTIQLFANRCSLSGISRNEGKDQLNFKFYEGLRVLIDDEVRLWTDQGTYDVKTQVLKSPGRTQVVQFDWPPGIDLKSMLVFMDPEAMGWLRMFGAPEPVLELEGEEFEFDATAFTFSANRKGRLRVRGNPGASFSAGPRKRKAKDIDPTELRCEGPLQLKNLGAAESDGPRTLHLTADKDVVIERLARAGTVRTHSDSASIYLAVPPKKVEGGEPRLLSALLKGRVRIEDDGGVTASAESLEWNHQEDLLRLTGGPKVEVVQGAQRLEARQVLIDRPQRDIEFVGDISVTFLSSTDPEAGAMTLVPGDLHVRTDVLGRPMVLQARRGVRIFTRSKSPGEEALEATGVEFEWDLVMGSGSLRGAPFARLEQGPNLVIAPLVTFEGGTVQDSVMTVKGPKVLRFFTEFSPPRNPGRDLVPAAMGLPGFRRYPEMREPALHTSATVLEAALGMPGLQRIPGRRASFMDLLATCDGDAVLDQRAGVVKLVDRCSVRSQDSTLFADKLFVVLKKAEDRGVERVVGLGNVRATQSPASGPALRVEGESLEMRIDSTLGSREQRIVRIVGHPLGRGWVGPAELSFRRLTLNLDDESGNLSVEIDQVETPGF